VKPAATGESGATPEMGAGRVAVKKAAGNVVEIGSIAAFGFSPLWLLAAASDVLNGTRVYLQTLEEELTNAGILAEGAQFGSVDQLLGALGDTTGTTAGVIDMPPIELQELRRSVSELAANATSLPRPGELAALFDGLVRTARAENRSLLEVSSGVGLAFLTSARNVTRDHLVAPYRDDWRPLRNEGFGAYAVRVSGPIATRSAGTSTPIGTRSRSAASAGSAGHGWHSSGFEGSVRATPEKRPHRGLRLPEARGAEPGAASTRRGTWRRPAPGQERGGQEPGHECPWRRGRSPDRRRTRLYGGGVLLLPDTTSMRPRRAAGERRMAPDVRGEGPSSGAGGPRAHRPGATPSGGRRCA